MTDPDSLTLTNIRFEEGRLTLAVSLDGRRNEAIVFEFPRAFRFFNESDAPAFLGSYYLDEPILHCKSGEGLYRSYKSLYLEEYRAAIPRSRLDNNLKAFLLVTPQECVEIVSFEEPVGFS